MNIYVEGVNREEENNHADWANRYILEQINRKEKMTKVLVFSLVLKSLWFVRKVISPIQRHILLGSD